MYVIVKNQGGQWMVGYYDPKGEWYLHENCIFLDMAEEKVHYLNGGDKKTIQPK